MPNITLKGVPDGLYNELKRRAAAARRSLNGEAIVWLERALAGPPDPRVDPVAFTAHVRETQAKYNIKPMTPEEIRDAIHEGRP
jgi:plasmid stability protein